MADGEGDDGVLLYEDEVSISGRLIVTTLDPVYHHGSNLLCREHRLPV